jgi:hypothetical protein
MDRSGFVSRKVVVPDLEFLRILDGLFHMFAVNMKTPFNAEPPFSVLTDSFITPRDFFFVR